MGQQPTLKTLGDICIERLKYLREDNKLNDEIDYSEYEERLEYELRVIGDFSFQNIFLITRQVIRDARSKGIIVGPGRGSAAGSLVCYLSEITTIDPLKFGLYFERFLNPGRVTSPDIDVDFSDREVPIEFLKKVYGENRVIQVGTKGLFKVKSSLDQFARVFDVPFEEAKRINKCYDNDGNCINVDAALQYRNKYTELFKTAEFFAGSKRFRNQSKHPSAVIVTNEPIGRLIPLQQVTDSKTKKKVFTTEWDGDELDSIGFTKFDFLRVSSLQVIADTINQVNGSGHQVLPGAQDIFNDIDYSDRETLDLFNRADLVGIFQLWKPECISVAKAITFHGFKEVYQLTTILRPGIDRSEWINKHEDKQPVTFICRELEPILADTYGIFLFQEQIMKACSDLAGFTLAESDSVRKVIAKTSNIGDTLSLKPYEDKFISGCVKNGIVKSSAIKIWNEILARQNYSFNQSHAVAYSAISWVCAYLKAHHPLEFYVACLNDKNESRFIDDARSRGINILPPDVNKSKVEHSIEDGAIRIGLGQIKHVGKSAKTVCKKAPYINLSDFQTKTKISSDKFASLRSAGAFDALKNDEFSNAFVERLAPNHFIKMFKERDAVGYFVTGSPLEEYGGEMDGCETDAACGKKKIKIGGIITEIYEHEARTGAMHFLKVQSLIDEFDTVVWPDELQKSPSYGEHSVIVADGVVTNRGNYALSNIKIL